LQQVNSFSSYIFSRRLLQTLYTRYADHGKLNSGWTAMFIDVIVMRNPADDDDDDDDAIHHLRCLLTYLLTYAASE